MVKNAVSLWSVLGLADATVVRVDLVHEVELRVSVARLSALRSAEV